MTARQSRVAQIRSWMLPPSLPEPTTGKSLEEIRRQVRQIEIRARRARRVELVGEYQTAFRGRGLEFAELRPYIPGDDVRGIDWKATARLREPMLRRYVEEREQSVLIMVDCSASMGFAASGSPVQDRAVEIAGVLGLSAASSNDRVGVAAFADDVRLAVPPAKGQRHVLRIIRDLIRLKPSGGTDLARAIRYAGRVMRRRGVIILISDFIGSEGESDWQASMSRLSRRHDVVAIALRDARATSVASAATDGIVQWSDSERPIGLSTDRTIAEAQQRALESATSQVGSRLRTCGCDVAQLTTGDDWLGAIVTLFRQRRQRP